MKHIFGVLTCWLLLLAGARAQNKLDSLYKALREHPGPDTLRLQLLNAAAFALYNVNPDSGVILSGEAVILSQRLGNKMQLAVSYRNKGLNYYAMGNDSLALQAYDQSLQLERSIGNPKGVGKTLHAIGLVYNSKSDYDKAIDYHSQAMAIFSRLKDENSIANSANSLGTNYMFLGDYMKAIMYYQQALKVYIGENNEKGMGQEYTNIGIVYRRMSDPAKAIEYNRKALACYTGSGDILVRARLLENMANAYDDMGSGEEALKYYKAALAINESLRNNRGIASNSLNIGIAYNGRGDYEKSFIYLNQGLKLYRELGDKNSTAIALSELGKACLQAPPAVLKGQDIKAGERYSVAERNERAALGLAEQIGAVDNQRDIWDYLARIYEANGETAAALDAYKHYLLMKDSVVNDSTRQKISGLILQFEHEKKEAALKAGFDKEQAIAAAQLGREQLVSRLVTAILAVFVLAVVVSAWFYKRKRETEQLQQAAERRSEIAELEMKALRSQMNPHFIFNSLNSISDYILKHRTEEACEYLARLARLMRLILENSQHREVAVSDDIYAMRLYIDLESMRLSKGFSYRIEVDETIDMDNTYIPPLILQPFIENSIWHGLAGESGREGQLAVGLYKKEGMLYCIVEDNGVGRITSAAKLNTGVDRKRSFGMKITADRIAMLNKTQPHPASMAVTDLEEGTRVEIWLPLMTG